eukprot:scaffold273166_cov46-Prasinocladus_malaysianus.AAC.3
MEAMGVLKGLPLLRTENQAAHLQHDNSQDGDLKSDVRFFNMLILLFVYTVALCNISIAVFARPTLAAR